MDTTPTPEDELRRIGSALVRQRMRANLTQQELADKTGQDVRTVGRHELGQNRMDILDAVAYANAMKCPIDQMIGRWLPSQAQPPLLRPGPLYVLDRAAVRAIHDAKTASQIVKLAVPAGYHYQAVIDPADEFVTEELWTKTRQEVDSELSRLHRKK